MSRTRAHRPWREIRDEAQRTGDYTGPEWRWHTSNGGRWRTRYWRRLYWGSVRAYERTALAHDIEPEPTRTRHSVQWELW